MSNLSEIEMMLGVLAFGFIDDVSKSPSKEEFAKAYSSVEGQNLLKDKVTLLHCTSEYPTPMNEINLKAMNTLQSAFKLPVGYSDHSDGLIVPLAAVARGAHIIEKHFTLDKYMPGPDHKSSLEPFELKEMVDAIKRIEIAIGDGIKRPTISEVKNKNIARKSIVAESSIVKGEFFTRENISIKRPGNGISPYKYWIMLGKIAKKDYQAGDLIDL
jgi:N-acetylneuraminate synthase